MTSATIVVTLLLGAATPGLAAASRADSSAVAPDSVTICTGAEADIYEATYRRLIHMAEVQRQHMGMEWGVRYFLSCGSDTAGRFLDADTTFLGRFEDLELDLRPYSRAASVAGRIEDRQTGQLGARCSVSIVEWLDADRVRVHAEATRSSVCSVGFRAIATLQDGRWILGDNEIVWRA